MAQQFLKLPVPTSIRPTTTDAESISLRWSIPASHGLSSTQLDNLEFEFKSILGGLVDSCKCSTTSSTYKARLCGLTPNTNYKFKIRSKLTLSSSQIVHSEWSDRFEFKTDSKMNTFYILTDPKEMEIASVKQKLSQCQMENKKLTLRVEQLEEQLNGTDDPDPAHWSWSVRHIVRWLTRIQDGALAQYKETLLEKMEGEGITGKDLVYVEESNLKSWGITGFGHRKIAIQHIKELTANDNKTKFDYHPSMATLLPDISASPIPKIPPLSSDMSTALEHVDEEQEVDDIVDEEPPAPEPQSEPTKEEESVDQGGDATNSTKTNGNDSKANEEVQAVKEAAIPSTEAEAKDEDDEEEKDSSSLVSASVRKLLDNRSPKVKEWKYKDGMVCVDGDVLCEVFLDCVTLSFIRMKM